MALADIRDFGSAENRPHDIDIFDGEGQTSMQHLSARGWEQPHIFMYCQEAQATRGEVEMKKVPWGGLLQGGCDRPKLGECFAMNFRSLLRIAVDSGRYVRRIKPQMGDHGNSVPQGPNPRQGQMQES